MFQVTPRPSATRATVRCWHTHIVTWDVLATALAAPIIRIDNAAGKDGTIRAEILPSHPKTEPIEPAECGRVRTLEGSVKSEGLAVENLDLDNLILSQGPHLGRNNLPPGHLTRQP